METSARGRLPPSSIVACLLAILAVVLVWNVFHFPWHRSYDASASAHYAQVLGHDHRLPRRDETSVWHNPPLFFAVAGAVYVVAEHIGLADRERLVQLFDALCVLGIAWLTYAMARRLLVHRWAPVLALGVVATTPVLVRAGAQFHPEPLATLLTTAGTYVLVRAFAERAITFRNGLLAGILLAGGALTRTWGLAAIGAAFVTLAVDWLWRRERQSVRLLAGLAAAIVVIVVPWLAIKWATYGSPLAYSQPDPAQWRQRGRPASFYTTLALDDVVHRPYVPFFRNELLPTVYTDWWGDYWRTWKVPAALRGDQNTTLPPASAGLLVRQVVGGAALSVVAVAAFVALAVRAVRRRRSDLLMLVLGVAFVGISFVGFLASYPKQDGDNIKALYLLDTVPGLAIAAAFGLSALGRRGLSGRIAATVVFLVAAVPTVGFVILR